MVGAPRAIGAERAVARVIEEKQAERMCMAILQIIENSQSENARLPATAIDA
jgi:hypothetical protein